MMRLGQPAWLVVISAGLFLCGGLLAASSLRTEQRMKRLPHMSCEDLIGNGRGAPQFLTLVDPVRQQVAHVGLSDRRSLTKK
jgi:hypothetical protein